MPEMNISPTDDDAVLKEVWGVDNIGAKTELNDVQIHSATNLLTMAQVFGNPVLNGHVTKFMELQKSRQRKSMEEFVAVVRAKKEDRIKSNGLFGGLMG